MFQAIVAVATAAARIGGVAAKVAKFAAKGVFSWTGGAAMYGIGGLSKTVRAINFQKGANLMNLLKFTP